MRRLDSNAMQSPMPPASRIAVARWVLATSILGSAMVFIDGTALSVALPSLQNGLRATGTDLLWVTNAFSLPLASLLLLGGSLGDSFGRKQVFTLGITLFASASLACGLASSVSALLVWRGLQGIGGALMIPGALAMVSTYFAPSERGRAIGTWSACSVLATAIGPVLGGVLARGGLWRWVFFINIPLAVAALTMLWRNVPSDSRSNRTKPVDWTGAFAVTIGLVFLNYGLLQYAKGDAVRHQAIAAIVVGMLGLVAFVWVQKRVSQPLLPLDIFRSRTLKTASLVSLAFYMAFHGMLFFLPLNLIQVQGYDPAIAGLTQLPLMALLIALSRVAGSMVDRYGPKLPLTLGPAIAGAGFAWLSVPGLTAGPKEFAWTYLPGLLLIGAGLGLTAAPLSTAVMGSMPSERLGLASGINSTLSRLAGVLAVAVFGTAAVIAFDRALPARTAPLNLAPEHRLHLTRESVRLAETQPPSGLSPESLRQVQHAIQLAFVDTFRLICALTALLSWSGAALAMILFKSGEGARDSGKTAT